jgi:hypothetical protein
MTTLSKWEQDLEFGILQSRIDALEVQLATSEAEKRELLSKMEARCSERCDHAALLERLRRAEKERDEAEGWLNDAHIGWQKRCSTAENALHKLEATVRAENEERQRVGSVVHVTAPLSAPWNWKERCVGCIFAVRLLRACQSLHRAWQRASKYTDKEVASILDERDAARAEVEALRQERDDAKANADAQFRFTVEAQRERDGLVKALRSPVQQQCVKCGVVDGYSHQGGGSLNMNSVCAKCVAAGMDP